MNSGQENARFRGRYMVLFVRGGTRGSNYKPHIDAAPQGEARGRGRHTP